MIRGRISKVFICKFKQKNMTLTGESILPYNPQAAG